MCSSAPYATSALEGDGSQRKAWRLDLRKQNPVPIVQEAE